MNRASVFVYAGLELEGNAAIGHYELDGRRFAERVELEEGVDLARPDLASVAELWYLVAGLSYYKAGAARLIDLGDTRVGERGLAFFLAALHDGLGEYSCRNDLPLDDVVIAGGEGVERVAVDVRPRSVLTPFGGGIDSVVTLESMRHLDQSLFVVSPSSGRFAPLETTAARTGLQVRRATRSLDPQILRGDPSFYNGHVPVTAMVTLLAALTALAHGDGGVAMSNEHSASVPNLLWRDRPINHQWSKSHAAEVLLADALEERLSGDFVVASYLRDRSEIWVAQRFAAATQYHDVFRSCNRAFRQDESSRARSWCGTCDKCLFINLVLAPFLTREQLFDIFGAEPLANPDLEGALASLVGLGEVHKPFECVGDPDESAVALIAVAADPAWGDVAALADLARLVGPDRSFEELLLPQGASRVPAHWLR